MNYLLDTCVLSEFTRKEPSPKVVEWLDKEPEENVYVSTLTVGELYKGIRKIIDVHAQKAMKLNFWLEMDVMLRFGDRILPVNNEIAIAWGILRAESEKRGVKRPTIDSLLAATAKVHNLTLVTRNVSDFLHTGISIFNLWEEE